MSRRGVAWSAIIAIGVVLGVSTRASAHPRRVFAGDAVLPEVVVGIAIIGGMIVGLSVVRSRVTDAEPPFVDRTTDIVGVALIAVGLSITLPAIRMTPDVAAVAIGVGVVVALVLLRNRETKGRGSTLALWCVVVHRVVEGIALGVAATTGSTVGLVGAGLLAGHAMIESASIGGLYAPDGTYRAVGAVVLIQVMYIVGAGIGGVTAAVVPSGISSGMLAGAGAVILVVGIEETGWIGRPDGDHAI